MSRLRLGRVFGQVGRWGEGLHDVWVTLCYKWCHQHTSHITPLHHPRGRRHIVRSRIRRDFTMLWTKILCSLRETDVLSKWAAWGHMYLFEHSRNADTWVRVSRVPAALSASHLFRGGERKWNRLQLISVIQAICLFYRARKNTGKCESNVTSKLKAPW